MYNYCKFAHSNEELDEWKERWDWRQMKREIAKREQVYSYMEALLEDYEEEYSGINVVSLCIVTINIVICGFVILTDANSSDDDVDQSGI